MSKMKLGDLLVEAAVIDEHQLEIAMAEQARTGTKLGRILIDLGLATEDAISRALASQTGVDHYDLDSFSFEPEAVQLVPEELARRRDLVPLRVQEGTILVAMANPADIVAIDEIERMTDLFVQVASASRRQVIRAIDRAYAGRSQGECAVESAVREAMSEIDRDTGSTSHGGVADLVEEIFILALRQDATDIHIEPDEKVVRIRFRTDGDLTPGPTLAGALLAPIVARIKVIAHLDIAETRLPQDGKIRFPYQRRKIDLRVSTFPAVHGESVVIRVLDRSGQQIGLDGLGLSDAQHATLLQASTRPNGLIVAAGPTGSGKTTTLYALLRSMDTKHRKVITLEDPVEYELPLITQCQINEKAGLSFAAGLRSILRHDPDVVLVGEMRDAETATMAFRAALTGHLVLSTIHTNDAVRTISRLRDMDIEPFLIASCLSAVSGQRLVRLVCDACRTDYTPRPDELAAAGFPPDTRGSFARGAGCEACHSTGTRGRQALFEVLEVGPEVAQKIGHSAPIDEIEAAARAAGMVTFREAAQARALAGEIPLEEIVRVTVES